MAEKTRPSRRNRRSRSGEVKRVRPGTIDYSLFAVTVVLILFGVIMVYSASAPYATRITGNPQYYFHRDLFFAGIGLIAMVLFSFISYRLYRKWAFLIYAGAFILCLLVFVPGIGVNINNSRRWIGFGEMTMMPSDLLKLASVIFLSSFLAGQSEAENRSIDSLVKVIALMVVTIVPVYFQPNFSAVMVLALSLFLLYYIGGMNLKHLLIFLLLGAVGAAIAFWPYPGNYRLERLKIVFDPLSDPMHSGWQLLQSLYAVSSGGLFGAGFGQSRQKFDYLADEPHNDFIFSVISEELGFLGALFVILALSFFIYRGLKAAGRAQTTFGRLLGYGLVLIISIQSMVNIGVAIGLVPPTGITLPFISYGGSSLVVMCMIAGILLNISRDGSEEKK